MSTIVDWLGDADRVADLGRRLCDGGVPADRVALFRRTLHPEILGRASAWSPHCPVEIFDREHGLDLSIGFAGSPLDQAMAEGVCSTLCRQEFDRAAGGWLDPFRGLDLAEIVVRPLPRGAALVIGTLRPRGFAESELVLLDRLMGRQKQGKIR